MSTNTLLSGLAALVLTACHVEPDIAEESTFRGLPNLPPEDDNEKWEYALPATCKYGKVYNRGHRFDHTHCIAGATHVCTHLEIIPTTCTFPNPAAWHAAAPQWVSSSCTPTGGSCSANQTSCGTKDHWCSDTYEGSFCEEIEFSLECDDVFEWWGATHGGYTESGGGESDTDDPGNEPPLECPYDASPWEQLQDCRHSL